MSYSITEYSNLGVTRWRRVGLCAVSFFIRLSRWLVIAFRRKGLGTCEAHTRTDEKRMPLRSLTHVASVLLFAQLPFSATAQVNTAFRDSVNGLFELLRTSDDSTKLAGAAQLEKMLTAYYTEQENFELMLDSTPFLGQIGSPDGLVKMNCWNIALSNGSFRYYCVMRHRPDKRSVVVTVFHDTEDWDRLNRRPVRPDRWYGALYYRILSHRYKGKTYYTLLGWDGKDNITNRKIIDVLTLQGRSVMLGASIFETENGTRSHRLVYEYANDVSMALNYDEKEKMIVMDHLSPEDSRFTGQYQFYGPDFSYDALRFVKGKWVLERDVFAKNRGLNNLPENARPGDFND